MTKKKWRVAAPRDMGNGKTFWQRVGTAFQNPNNISVIFSALPLPGPDGVCQVFLFEDDDSKPRTQEAKAKPKSNRPLAEELDDEIPF